MNYRFHTYDYILYILSYLFFGLYLADINNALPPALSETLPSWSFLAVAVALNAWAIPIPGIHPRKIPEEQEPERIKEPAPEAGALPEPKKKPAPSPKEKLEKGLSKTHKGFIDRISAVFRRSAALDGTILSELEETLVGTDIGVRTAYTIFDYIQKNADTIRDADQAMDAIKTEITAILEKREEPLSLPEGTKPFVIMVSGVNGSGKTTTIAKIAYHLK
ncbi:MAG TPA: signal recognition particle receptor subunit alpha, partial [Deltaproteobacteria bacterium]|nr:signal recognition particle receptor subunit alpha [Deltaproteobacteria bacterium]